MRRMLFALAVVMLFATSCTWISRVTYNAAGPELSAEGKQAQLSEDGRFVVFESRDQLIADDTNGTFDVYWKDLQAGDVVRISVDSGGAQANLDSRHPHVSASGQFVLFWSQADLTGDGGGSGGLFVADTTLDTLERVADIGTVNHSLSDDGRYVGFSTAQDGLVAGDVDGQRDFFIYDRQLDSHQLINEVRADKAVISGDARHVVFRSSRSSLVPNDTNGVRDLFRYDTVTDTYVRLTRDVFGGQLSSVNGLETNFVVSADGNEVLFEIGLDLQVPGGSETASTLYLADVTAGNTTLVSVDTGGTTLSGPTTYPIALSDDGTLALLQGDSGNGTEIFLRDITAGVTTRPVLDSDDTALLSTEYWSQGDLSGDGRYVAYERGFPVEGQAGLNVALVVARVQPPTISSVSPDTASANQTVTLTVFGSGFEPGAVATIVGSDTTVHSTTFVSESELAVVVTTSPTVGTFSVWVEIPEHGPGFFNADYSGAVCPYCLSITTS